MKKVVEILMKRDNLSEADAKAMYDDTMAEIQDAIAEGDLELAEEIFMDNLGLEPDYLFDVFI